MKRKNLEPRAGVVIALMLSLVLLWLLHARRLRQPPGIGSENRSSTGLRDASPSTSHQSHEQWRRRWGANYHSTAEEVVTARVSDFARKRLGWVRAKSLQEGKDVPREVEDFFAALQRGKWDEIEAGFSALAKRSAQYDGSTHWPELDPFWPAVLEAYGAAEQAHLWPADKLLQYGESILGSLRPGMVYVGGTDPGRFVPTLLNETGEGEPHIVLTQNALADSRYLEYARNLFGDRLVLPTDDDSKKIFDDYVAEARQRLLHDQEFPNEARQIKPGENVEMVDGKVQVSGQIAVMAINEKLLQWTLEKNPKMSFAVEESVPFQSTYQAAAPLGPIMELRAEEPFAERHATETLEYWRAMAEELKLRPPDELANRQSIPVDRVDPWADGVGAEGAAELKTYSHMAVSQANLLASHNYAAEAEATYRLATQIFSRNPEATLALSQFLSAQGRAAEASEVIAEFRRQNPDVKME